MRLVTKEGIGRLLRANPIAELAAERGISLEPLGAELFVGRCPRHPEMAGRSLLVEPSMGRFRCLVCSFSGGDSIAFVMLVDGLPFVPALHELARRAGLDLDEVMSEAQPAICSYAPRPARRRSVPLWALTPVPEGAR